MDYQQIGADRSERDRCEIPGDRVGHLGNQRRQDGKRGDMAHHHGVAVGRGSRGQLRRQHAGCARAIIDDDLLAEALGQSLRDDTPDDIGSAPRRKSDQHPHRFDGVLLCRGRTGGGNRSEKRGGSANQGFHDFPLRFPAVVNSCYGVILLDLILSAFLATGL